MANGTRIRFKGLVSEAATMGKFGGMARDRLRLQARLWRMGQGETAAYGKARL